MENMIDDVDLEMEADIPDPEHVVTILEGIQDSLSDVTGNEGFTSAQHYLGSVLVTNGYVRRNQVGQEGFFAKVGDGAKAAIEYVKKMFRDIFDFFFKRDAPKLIAEAKTEVKDGNDVIKLIETGGSNEKETDEALRHLRSVTLALTHQPDANKSALDQILKEADEAMKGSQADKKKAVLSIGHELPKLNKRGQANFMKRLHEVIRSLERGEVVLQDIVKKGEEAGASASQKNLSNALKPGLPHLASGIASFKKVTGDITTSALKGVYTEVVKGVEASEREQHSLVGLKTEIQNNIKAIESGNDAEAKKSLEHLKSMLSGISSMIRVGKDSLSAMKALVKAGSRTFGY